MTKPQIIVRLSPSLLRELNQYVEKTGTSKIDVVVSVIAQYLGCAENVLLNQQGVELKAQMKKLTALVKFSSRVKEVG